MLDLKSCLSLVAVDEKHLRAAMAAAIVNIRAGQHRLQGLGIALNIYLHGKSLHIRSPTQFLSIILAQSCKEVNKKSPFREKIS